MSEIIKKLIEDIKKKVEEERTFNVDDLEWFSNDFEPIINRFCESIENTDKDDEYILRGFDALLGLMDIRFYEPYAKADIKHRKYEAEFEEYSDSETYEKKEGELRKIYRLYFERYMTYIHFANAFTGVDKWHYELTDADREEEKNPVSFIYGNCEVDREVILHKRNIAALEDVLGEKFAEFDEFMGR